MRLHNIYDSETLRKKLEASGQARVTISFYKYFSIPEPAIFRDLFYALMESIGVLGRIYVAQEGINAQISVPHENLIRLRELLDTIRELQGIRLNVAIEDNGKSFIKLKVKARPKIVADGLTDFRFDGTGGGEHLNAEEWNLLLDDPDAVVVDMRNHYESEVGRFDHAALPDVDTTRDLLPHVAENFAHAKDKKLLMYCTGGIRCEKASAYMRSQGYGEVYQLNGGIIEYARQIREKGLESRFHGKNFVFDDRLGERITDEVLAHCHQCGKACDTQVNCRNKACNLLFIQCEDCAKSHHGCCSVTCAGIAALSEEDQRSLRKGASAKGPRYAKGRVPEKATLANLRP